MSLSRRPPTHDAPRLLAPAVLLLPAIGLTALVFWMAMGVLLVLSAYPFLTTATPRVTFAAWAKFLGDPYYWSVVGETLRLGVVTTILSLVIGYPVAYAMTKIRRPAHVLLATILLFSPILVSVVVRTYGWLLLLARDGAVNYALAATGLTHRPLALIYNQTGVVIAMVHILLPFMTFPALSVLNQISPQLAEAATDLGATRAQRFLKVTLPLSLPGIISGCQIVFTLTVSAFVTPFIMSGGKVQTLSGLIYRDMEALNFSFVSVTAFVLLGLSLVILAISNMLGKRAYARAETSS